MPRVSVVIPAYNAAACLAETLRSIVDSTFVDREIVVIDDGSNDATAEIAASFGPSVRVISRSNHGMSASRNFGIETGDSEFVALCDSDDVWHPEKLRHQVAALEIFRDHGFCFTDFTPWDGADATSFLVESRTGAIDPGMTGWVYHHLILTNWSLPSSLLFRRTAWCATGPFLCDDQQTDDWEFLVRSSRSYRFVRLAESMVLYRQSSSSLSRRLPPIDTTELMRDTLLARYGGSSPDGTPVDAVALAHWRFLGHSHFADAHCAAGDMRTGLAGFAKLLKQGPLRAETVWRLCKSLRRRVFPVRS